jgi:ABC-type glycerol-3-phosphate transport system substrate-binding protein
MAKKTLTRRDFIKVAGATLGTSLLAACAPQVVTQIVQQTVIANQTSVVKETSIVNQVITATSAPTNTPEPAVLEIWWNDNIPDLTAKWDPTDPNNVEFKNEWYFGGLGRLKYIPWLAKHPGVTLHITGHSWDVDLRTNQLLALASGQMGDTTYGEAYVNEFVQLGVYSDLDPKYSALFPAGPLGGATVAGKVYGLPKSTGADVLFINLDKVTAAGLDASKLPATWDDLVTMAQAIQKKNYNAKWGNTAYYTYGPGGTSYGQAMRILHWFNQNNCPLADADNKPQANLAASTDTWFFHNELLWSSTLNLINQAESEGGSGELFNTGVIALKPGWNNDATSVGNAAKPVNAVAVPFPIPAGGKPATIVIGNDMESALKASKYLDLAKLVVEETTTDETAQAFLANTAGCGVWIPALTSLLSQFATYDKLAGYAADVAKKMVRVTMSQALNGNAGPVPGWKKNGSDIWTEWNACYGRILGPTAPGLSKVDIQKQLDALQAYIVSRLNA